MGQQESRESRSAIPLPGDRIRIAETARRKSIRGKTARLVRYTNAIIEVDGVRVNVTPQNFDLAE